jgi:ABC-2 type transport system permease protein
MGAQLRSELLKQWSTRTNLGLLAAMIVLVLAAVLLHGLVLPARDILGRADQLELVVGWGEKLGVLFAGLLGAMSMTTEFRHGTIRPTFLVAPRRPRVVVAKVVAGILYGAGFGLTATAVAVGAGTVVLESRGIENRIDLGAYSLFLVGGAVGAALWAVLGVGVGALLRNQVPVLIGLCAWLLFIEGLLLGDLFGAIGSVSRFAPGTAAAAGSGLHAGDLLPPALALSLLAFYAAAAATLGAITTARRDVP